MKLLDSRNNSVVTLNLDENPYICVVALLLVVANKLHDLPNPYTLGYVENF